MWGVVGKFTLRFWAVIGFCSTVIGFGGVPDDIENWTKWLGRIMTDPLVVQLATYAVELAQFINQAWVRVSLVVLGMLMILWPLRWFWRVRHKIKFRWRRLVADKVWIAEDEAKRLIKESPWGRLKEPNVVQSVSVLDSWAMGFQRERVVYGMSETQKKLLKFEHFVSRTLESFCEANPTAKRTEDGANQVEETALRAFLKKAMDEELSDEFGDAPKFRVT